MSSNVNVPLSDILVDDELLEAAREAIASGWWSMGPRVESFEHAFAEYLGCTHAFAVASGTAALHLALLGVGCGRGDEVVLPSLNFVAAANAVRHTGAVPVFCDVLGEDDLNLDVSDVERALTPRVKAIVALHYGGYPCDMDSLLELAEGRGITVIEDAAHAVGSRFAGGNCGTFGAAGCFSFFSNKNMPVAEGGMLVTDDDALADRFRLLRSHGMTTLTWDRHRGHAHTYDVVLPGFNYRLDEIRAAMGIVQLGRLEAQNSARGNAARRYVTDLDQKAGLVTPFAERIRNGKEPLAHHLAVILLPAGADRQAFRTELREKEIQTSVHYPPIHAFTEYSSNKARSLPNTEALATRLVTLPLFSHISEEQLDHVIKSVLRSRVVDMPAAPRAS
jgi:dTDP-4-amino-4,6-dideoxygalactose transaminase